MFSPTMLENTLGAANIPGWVKAGMGAFWNPTKLGTNIEVFLVNLFFLLRGGRGSLILFPFSEARMRSFSAAGNRLPSWREPTLVC